jgi:hypothetical protein
LFQGLDHHGAAVTNASITVVITNSSAIPRQAIVINEWMADNTGPGGLYNPVEKSFPDWFELYNPNPIPVDLSGFYLTDHLDQPDLWRIPVNTEIGPRGFLLVWADNATELNGTDGAPDLHVSFQLAKSGDAIGLFGPDGTPEHTVTFGRQISNVSQGLFPDGNTNTVYDLPNWTPGGPNALGKPVSPDFTQIRTSSQEGVALSFHSITGHAYQVQYATDFKAALWSALGTQFTATSEFSTVVDSSVSRPRRFYRVMLVQ